MPCALISVNPIGTLTLPARRSNPGVGAGAISRTAADPRMVFRPIGRDFCRPGWIGRRGRLILADLARSGRRAGAIA
jgi:hypothetical protein